MGEGGCGASGELSTLSRPSAEAMGISASADNPATSPSFRLLQQQQQKFHSVNSFWKEHKLWRQGGNITLEGPLGQCGRFGFALSARRNGP